MTIGIGICGCGFIASFHAGCLQALIHGGHVDAKIVAVCDTDPDRARAFARTYGGAQVLDTVDEVASHPGIDAVYVCTPTVAHSQAVEVAAAAGKAVFCEKPLAFDAAGAQCMQRMVAEAGVVERAGLVLRFSPTYREMARRVAGAGELMSVVFRDDQFIPIRGYYGSTWRADAAVAGAGAILEHSIHDVDVLRWMCGDIDRVTAQTRCVGGHTGIEDIGVVTVEFASGAVGTLVSLWHDIDSRPSTRRLEVFCRDTFLVTDHDVAGPVVVETSDTRVEVAAKDSIRHLCEELGVPAGLAELGTPWLLEDWAFCETLAGHAVPGASFADAVAAHAVVDAIYASAAEGGIPVRVCEPRLPEGA